MRCERLGYWFKGLAYWFKVRFAGFGLPKAHVHPSLEQGCLNHTGTIDTGITFPKIRDLL